MIGFYELDMMVRGGSIGLLALWTWLLLRDHRDALAGRVAAAMNAAIVCHIIATIPGSVQGAIATPLPAPSYYGLIDWVAELGSVTVPVLFWLFARAWFNDEQEIGWRSWLLVPVCMAMIVIVDLNFTARNTIFYAGAAVLRVAMFVFAICGLWIAWRGREGDLIEERRRLRVLLVGAVGAFVLLTNAVEVAVFNNLIAREWRSLLQVGILALTFGFCGAMFGIRQPDLLGPAARRSEETDPARSATDDPLAERLLAHMTAELPYREEGLSIAKLAAQLGEPEYRLRRLINGALGHRNFAQFLNGYRLAEVKAALVDPAQKGVPILTIALDAGFGSLGPFNRAFRDAEGITPSEYRTRALADSGIG